MHLKGHSFLSQVAKCSLQIRFLKFVEFPKSLHCFLEPTYKYFENALTTIGKEAMNTKWKSFCFGFPVRQFQLVHTVRADSSGSTEIHWTDKLSTIPHPASPSPRPHPIRRCTATAARPQPTASCNASSRSWSSSQTEWNSTMRSQFQ